MERENGSSETRGSMLQWVFLGIKMSVFFYIMLFCLITLSGIVVLLCWVLLFDVAILVWLAAQSQLYRKLIDIIGAVWLKIIKKDLCLHLYIFNHSMRKQIPSKRWSAWSSAVLNGRGRMLDWTALVQITSNSPQIALPQSASFTADGDGSQDVELGQIGLFVLETDSLTLAHTYSGWEAERAWCFYVRGNWWELEETEHPFFIFFRLLKCYVLRRHAQ